MLLRTVLLFVRSDPLGASLIIGAVDDKHSPAAFNAAVDTYGTNIMTKFDMNKAANPYVSLYDDSRTQYFSLNMMTFNPHYECTENENKDLYGVYPKTNAPRGDLQFPRCKNYIGKYLAEALVYHDLDFLNLNSWRYNLDDILRGDIWMAPAELQQRQRIVQKYVAETDGKWTLQGDSLASRYAVQTASASVCLASDRRRTKNPWKGALGKEDAKVVYASGPEPVHLVYNKQKWDLKSFTSLCADLCSSSDARGGYVAEFLLKKPLVDVKIRAGDSLKYQNALRGHPLAGRRVFVVAAHFSHDEYLNDAGEIRAILDEFNFDPKNPPSKEGNGGGGIDATKGDVIFFLADSNREDTSNQLLFDQIFKNNYKNNLPPTIRGKMARVHTNAHGWKKTDADVEAMFKKWKQEAGAENTGTGTVADPKSIKKRMEGGEYRINYATYITEYAQSKESEGFFKEWEKIIEERKAQKNQLAAAMANVEDKIKKNFEDEINQITEEVGEYQRTRGIYDNKYTNGKEKHLPQKFQQIEVKSTFDPFYNVFEESTCCTDLHKDVAGPFDRIITNLETITTGQATMTITNDPDNLFTDTDRATVYAMSPLVAVQKSKKFQLKFEGIDSEGRRFPEKPDMYRWGNLMHKPVLAELRLYPEAGGNAADKANKRLAQGLVKSRLEAIVNKKKEIEALEEIITKAHVMLEGLSNAPINTKWGKVHHGIIQKQVEFTVTQAQNGETVKTWPYVPPVSELTSCEKMEEMVKSLQEINDEWHETFKPVQKKLQTPEQKDDIIVSNDKAGENYRRLADALISYDEMKRAVDKWKKLGEDGFVATSNSLPENGTFRFDLKPDFKAFFHSSGQGEARWGDIKGEGFETKVVEYVRDEQNRKALAKAWGDKHGSEVTLQLPLAPPPTVKGMNDLGQVVAALVSPNPTGWS